MKKYKAVIVGGGSTWTPGLLKSLCERQADFPLEELRMYDIDAERQAVIGEFAKVLFAEESCIPPTRLRHTKMWTSYSVRSGAAALICACWMNRSRWRMAW